MPGPGRNPLLTSQTEGSAVPGIRRLNWGCGGNGVAGWVNSDLKSAPGIDITGDILQSLPLETDSFDYAVSVHALQEIPFDRLVDALRELRRVLKPGGVLRLILPDADRAIEAYLRKDRDYFLVPDEDASSLGGKFVTHILWYGYSRTMFTRDYIDELLRKAEFSHVHHCSHGQTRSAFAGITSLDNREQESLFVEGVK